MSKNVALGVISSLRRRRGLGVIVSEGSTWAFDFGNLVRIWTADELDVGVRVAFRKKVTRRGRRHALEVHPLG